MYEERTGKKIVTESREIVGTFNRELSIENDFLHFFAPGDEVFDCIVDNAMNSYRNSIKQIVALREVRNQGIETLKLSLELYKQGLSPFQNVLDAQRSLLSYENQLVQAQGSSLLQLIALYKALGGGWQE